MSIETTTIALLRAETSSTADIYYTTDFGKEGEWYYDSFDTSSDDNEGTVLVSTNNLRFKRIFNKGIVNAPWFFKSTDADATEGIQRALDYISDTSYIAVENHNSGGGTVFLPKGIYLISNSLKIGQHCRLLGVSKSATNYNDYTSGSVILVNPNTISTFNMWAIESATYFVVPNTNPVQQEIISYDSFCDDKYYYYSFLPLIKIPATDTHSIVIESITIYCNEIYGGIKLTNSPYSKISDVSIFASNIGIYLNNCWNCSVYDNYTRRVNWYGIVLVETNACCIINCTLNGKEEDQRNEEKYLIPEEDLPQFVTITDYNDSGLDERTRRGRTGIYVCRNGNANEIMNCSSEAFTNGIVSVDSSNLLIDSVYIENIVYYGIVTGIGTSLTEMNTLYFEGIGIFTNNSANLLESYPFYFGSDTYATINAANCWVKENNNSVGVLFKIETNQANIIFSNTRFVRRIYNKLVSFIDERPEGANNGAVYVNPENGNDENYGFNEGDALWTFDAALIRVQDQKTINPVKVIYIKAARAVDKIAIPPVNPMDDAAIKNLDIVRLENVDILITAYGIEEEANPPKRSARIYFENNVNPYAQIGRLELSGNVNLVFRKVDLYCNAYTTSIQTNPDQTIFGLIETFARLTFEGGTNNYVNIQLESQYKLVEANIIDGRKSLLDIKFVNTNVAGGWLSPTQNGNQNLAIDCTAVNSTDGSGGWQDVEIIRNNF